MSEFKWLNKQGVESDKGFIVQRTGRFTLEYRQGNFRMECLVEGVENRIGVSVPELPFGNLTETRRSEIVQEIRDALEFQGLEVDIA
jgi:hypothetical protein